MLTVLYALCSTHNAILKQINSMAALYRFFVCLSSE